MDRFQKFFSEKGSSGKFKEGRSRLTDEQTGVTKTFEGCPESLDAAGWLKLADQQREGTSTSEYSEKDGKKVRVKRSYNAIGAREHVALIFGVNLDDQPIKTTAEVKTTEPSEEKPAGKSRVKQLTHNGDGK